MLVKISIIHKIEAHAQRGADFETRNFQPALACFLLIMPPLAPKTLACTDWVASQYIWGRHGSVYIITQHTQAKQARCFGVRRLPSVSSHISMLYAPRLTTNRKQPLL